MLPYDTLTFLKFGVRSLVMGLEGEHYPTRLGVDIAQARGPGALIGNRGGVHA